MRGHDTARWTHLVVAVAGGTWALASGDGLETGSSAEGHALSTLESLLQGYEGGVPRFWKSRPKGPFKLSGGGRSFKWLFNLAELSSAISPSTTDPSRIHEPITYDNGIAILRWTEADGRVNHPIVEAEKGAKADGKTVRALYDEGWSVILWKANRFFKNVLHLAGSLEQYTMFPVSAAIFITPPSSQGLDFHYDSKDSFFIQIEGSKNWSVFPPLVKHPTSMLEEPYIIKERDAPARIKKARQGFVLREGDILWVPRGWFHCGAAIGPVGSVHLSLRPELFTWAEIFQRLGILDRRVLERPASPPEHIATDGGIPLALRRDAPRRLGHLGASEFRRELLAVAEKAGVPDAAEIPPEFLTDWLNDFVASLTEEVFPPAGVYPPDSTERLPEKRSREEVAALNIDLATPLRVTSTMAARVVSKMGSGRSRFVLVRYSTGNSNVRYTRTSEPLKVPRQAAAALRKLLHVEQNPSGRFAPAEIHGVEEEMQLAIAKDLLRVRAAVLESEWHSGSGGFVPPLPSVLTSRDSSARAARAPHSEL